ncbi:hypothetical protein A2U01_0064102, partial [Trifolium medium]|nr:hypothetical protein [Trifolium medium]
MTEETPPRNAGTGTGAMPCHN